ncbi:alpha/beta hydrolase family protein [Aurantiacibacter sediminis]|uniref:Uncharacterized protein n=1 Tax=Aurantiacibacter sediminis TaxID=2793064 RepID=A0ABS0N474_9SPHN|nr:hypothetical protein [Aurantiacibacter sediminis]MBH5322774.1 hypothetical protein [Aurantiacibacter sediminis]
MGTWPSDAYFVRFDNDRGKRLLIVPPLFDEANKLRHMIMETMRALNTAGIDSALIDLPGTNESPEPLPEQTLHGWIGAVEQSCKAFSATHILAVRAGAACVTAALPCLLYAPHSPASQLRSMIRARVLSEREAEREVSREELLAEAEHEGITLAGYHLSADMVRQMQGFFVSEVNSTTIAQSEIGGAPLWLRAEPDHDPDQSKALAARIEDLMS